MFYSVRPEPVEGFNRTGSNANKKHTNIEEGLGKFPRPSSLYSQQETNFTIYVNASNGSRIGANLCYSVKTFSSGQSRLDMIHLQDHDTTRCRHTSRSN